MASLRFIFKHHTTNPQESQGISEQPGRFRFGSTPLTLPSKTLTGLNEQVGGGGEVFWVCSIKKKFFQ